MSASDATPTSLSELAERWDVGRAYRRKWEPELLGCWLSICRREVSNPRVLKRWAVAAAGGGGGIEARFFTALENRYPEARPVLGAVIDCVSAVAPTGDVSVEVLCERTGFERGFFEDVIAFTRAGAVRPSAAGRVDAPILLVSSARIGSASGGSVLVGERIGERGWLRIEVVERDGAEVGSVYPHPESAALMNRRQLQIAAANGWSAACNTLHLEPKPRGYDVRWSAQSDSQKDGRVIDGLSAGGAFGLGFVRLLAGRMVEPA